MKVEIYCSMYCHESETSNLLSSPDALPWLSILSLFSLCIRWSSLLLCLAAHSFLCKKCPLVHLIIPIVPFPIHPSYPPADHCLLGMEYPRWCRGVAGGNPGNPENPESQNTYINMPIGTHSSATNLPNSSAYRSAPKQAPTLSPNPLKLSS